MTEILTQTGLKKLLNHMTEKSQGNVRIRRDRIQNWNRRHWNSVSLFLLSWICSLCVDFMLWSYIHLAHVQLEKTFLGSPLKVLRSLWVDRLKPCACPDPIPTPNRMRWRYWFTLRWVWVEATLRPHGPIGKKGRFPKRLKEIWILADNRCVPHISIFIIF